MNQLSKYLINICISDIYLFDGYLTERAIYPQWQAWPYLTDSPAKAQGNTLKPCVSMHSLFDGYLTVRQ